MRGCLFVLLAGAAVLFAGAWFAGPPLAGALVATGLALTGFEGRDTEVTVIADPPVTVLTGRADAVRISSRDVRFDGWTAGSVDLTLADVRLVERTAERVRGSVGDLVIDASGPGDLVVSALVVDGPIGRADATLRLPARSVEDLLAARIEASLGTAPGTLRLQPPDVVSLVMAGGRVEARLVVEPSGDLVLRLPIAGGTPIHVASAARLAPLRIAELEADGGDLVLRGTLDVGRLLR